MEQFAWKIGCREDNIGFKWDWEILIRDLRKATPLRFGRDENAV
jgi:hypothetical protein